MKLNRRLLVVCSIFVAALFLSQGLEAKTFRITIGGGYNVDLYPVGKKWKDEVCANIKSRVEKETQDKIDWVFAWAGAVAKVGEELNAIESGSLKMGLVVTPAETAKLYLNSFSYNVPFGSPDTEKASRVNLEVYRKNMILQDVFAKYNQKWLGLYSFESYDILTNFPFQKLSELKGKKIGALGANIPWLTGVGATPVQSNSGEAYTSIQTGVYQGFLFPISYSVGPKVYEVAKYATFLSLGGPAGPCWTINLDLWKSLPQKIQQIIWEEAQKYNDAIPGIVAKMKTDAIQQLKEKGVTFYTLSPEDRKEWMAALKDMPRNFIKECEKRGLPGKQVVQSYLEEMEKTGYTWPIKYQLE